MADNNDLLQAEILSLICGVHQWFYRYTMGNNLKTTFCWQ